METEAAQGRSQLSPDKSGHQCETPETKTGDPAQKQPK
jgi:hypothetical protein